MLWGRQSSIWLGNMAWGSTLGGALESLQGASVLLRTADQLFTALGLIELDGVAARVVIAPPDVKDEHLPAIIQSARIAAVVGEDPTLAAPGTRFVRMTLPLTPLPDDSRERETEWVLFPSRTGGIAKMTAHSLAGLTGAIRPDAAKDIVWSMFCDIRRYGGLQILLRALLGRAPLILPDAQEDLAAFLVRLGRHGVTHLAGTPSHWRRALMSPANLKIAPHYVRLCGEIADQAILDALRVRFPEAVIGHAYASTEAGVCFEVTDGLEGFPASLIGQPGPVEMKIQDGTLRIRSPRTAKGYVGGGELLTDGFVDTGDVVEAWSPRTSRGGEKAGDRYVFAGRRGGILDGGLKIAPEVVEAAIGCHYGVRASLV